MRSLVTGATGFLGVNLCERLVETGIATTALVRSSAKAQALQTLGVRLMEGDITDAEAVGRAMDGVDVVFHLAGKLFIPGVPDDEYQRIHVEGTRIAVAQARQRHIRRFVHCSTTGVFGTTGDHPADETAPFAPTNTYERTKLAGERLIWDAMQEGLEAVIIRPGLVYGPGDLHLLGFFHSIQRGLFRPIGRAPVWLHPIYIDDMSEGMLRAATAPQAAGEAFNLAGSAPATLLELSREIATALNVRQPRGWIPLPVARTAARLGDALPDALQSRAPLTSSRLDFLTHSRMYDVSKAHRLLDFSAETPLSLGIGKAAAWYRAKHLL